MKSLIVISLIVVLKVLGDVSLSHGMREVGEMHPLHPLAMLEIGLHMVTNPWIDVATTLLLTYTLLLHVGPFMARSELFAAANYIGLRADCPISMAAAT